MTDVKRLMVIAGLLTTYCISVESGLGARGMPQTPPQPTAPAGQAQRPPRPGVKDPAVIQRPLTTVKPEFVFTIDGTPDWVAVGPDSIWFSKRPNSLMRLDPKTNQIVVATLIGKQQCSGMVYGFGSMWLPHCGEKALYRVDVKSHKVLATIPVGPAASEGGLAATAEAIWITSDPKGVLSRIDPKTNTVAAEITTPAGCHDAATGFGSLWVTCTSDDLLLRVNPSNNQIEQRIPVGDGPRFLATGEGAVWTLNEVDGSITRVDPETNKAVANIDAGVPRAGDIAVGEGAVWVSAFEFPITRIDPATNKVTHQFSGVGGDAIRAAFGSVWLSFLREGYIWRIDPRKL